MNTLKRKSLYDLTEDMLILEAKLEDCETEEDAGAVIQEFADLSQMSADKVENYIRLMENLDIEASVATAEYEAYRDKVEKYHIAAKNAQNRIKWLKGGILRFLQATGQTELATAHHKVKVQANGGKASVHYPAKINFENWDRTLYSVKFEPDDDAIRDFAKAGSPLPEGVIVEKGYHIKITGEPTA